jgi:hypothetical protein
MSSGDLVELSAASGEIDTTDQLNMFELYQKVFVVNGSNLKVIDFLNKKIVDANGFTNKPAKGDLVYQDATDSADDATILVDYIDSANNTLYGYVVAGTLETGRTINTEPAGAGNVILPSPDSVTANPHWYAWTPYDNDTDTYGSMPSKAYLGCNYRGRAVLAGHPAYPYQWYMSRQGNPWDWNYATNDAQSPVAGNSADAGEIGDIVRALIPFKDQYLIFGCANSLWYLRGDPAISGAIDSLDRTTGVFGANSWCFSPDSLFFWGTGGIYECKLGEGGPSRPVLLTGFSLPNIIKDEAVDPSTHRIIMGYDRKRVGIVISITTLADGTNSNYWYDLRTEGFFPESYPEECAAYSMVYYDANDNDYADLLLGGRDGYILKFSDTAKNDDIGVSDEAISSNCVLPITKLSEQEDKEGKVTSMTIVTAGGASSGVFGDTDGVSYERHAGDDAETVLENIVDGDTAFDSGTLTGTGRKNRIRDRIRGMFLGLKLYNNTASQSWAIDEVQVDVKEAGRK